MGQDELRQRRALVHLFFLLKLMLQMTKAKKENPWTPHKTFRGSSGTFSETWWTTTPLHKNACLNRTVLFSNC